MWDALKGSPNGCQIGVDNVVQREECRYYLERCKKISLIRKLQEPLLN